MNFSNFAYLKDQGGYIENCVKHCMEAEKKVRVRPADTAANARRAIEQLFKVQSKAHRLKPANLAESIEQNCKFIEDNNAFIKKNSNVIRSKANTIRKYGNNAVHYNINNHESIDAANQKNIRQAITIIRDLYDLLCEFYGKSVEFDEDLIPFDEYTIFRQVYIPEEMYTESYFIHTSGPRPHYYYLQCLSLIETLELDARREEASDRVYQDHKRNSQLLIPNVELGLPENSDRKIVIYDVSPDSFLLSELKTSMTLKQALKVGLDLISALEDMKYLGMYHRNIFPGCVLMGYDRKGDYEACLLNLQTSKVLGSDATVNHLLAIAWDRNLYIPEHLRAGHRPDTDWEKVDVYALCRLVLFCLDRELAVITTTASLSTRLNLNLSDRFRKLYDALFRCDPLMRRIPTLEELREIFEDEYNLCN